MKDISVFLMAACFAATPFAYAVDNPADGLRFDLDLRGEPGHVIADGNIGNLLSSSSSGVTAGGNHETNKPALVSTTLVAPTSPWATNTVKAGGAMPSASAARSPR